MYLSNPYMTHGTRVGPVLRWDWYAVCPLLLSKCGNTGSGVGLAKLGVNIGVYNLTRAHRTPIRKYLQPTRIDKSWRDSFVFRDETRQPPLITTSVSGHFKISNPGIIGIYHPKLLPTGAMVYKRYKYLWYPLRQCPLLGKEGPSPCVGPSMVSPVQAHPYSILRSAKWKLGRFTAEFTARMRVPRRTTMLTGKL